MGVGGGVELSNLELIKTIWALLNDRGLIKSTHWRADVKHVVDRAGHDFRYNRAERIFSISGKNQACDISPPKLDDRFYLKQKES